MKKICMLTTGGTLASRRTAMGLTPLMTSEELLRYVPGVRKFCQVDTVQLFHLDSTNMRPQNWLALAAAIEERYAAYDGFVVTHGTDTMAYTAAALSYLIQDSQKPIVVTGAQRPIDMENTDGRQNLIDSFRYAAWDGAAGVTLLFDGKVILGTRAKKLRTKSYNAFSSINFPNLAVLREDRIIDYIRLPKNNKPVFYHKLNDSVGMLKLIPSTCPEVLDFYLSRFDGVIVESFGSGGLPEVEGCRFDPVLEKYPEKVLVMTTQAPIEGSDLVVYTVGRALKERYGFLEAYDMTLEAVVAKLMWILGQTKQKTEIERLFYTPVGNDVYAKEEHT